MVPPSSEVLSKVLPPLLSIGVGWGCHEATKIHSPLEDGNLRRRKSCIPKFLRLPLRTGGPFEGLDIASSGLVQHLFSFMHCFESIQHICGKLELLFGAALICPAEEFQGVLASHDSSYRSKVTTEQGRRDEIDSEL